MGVLITAIPHTCSGVGELDFYQDAGRYRVKVDGSQANLPNHEIDVQHFQDGSTRAICQFATEYGCEKLLGLTRESLLPFLNSISPRDPRISVAFNVSRALCKWDTTKK